MTIGLLTVPDDDGLPLFIKECQAAAAVRTQTTTNRPPSSPAVVSLQPHPDDVALSIGGLLARVSRNVRIITVFGGSPSSGTTESRAAEDAELAKMLGADLHYFDFTESKSSARFRIDDSIAKAVGAHTGSIDVDLMLAPAAVSRHPDHRAVFQIAADSGCGVYWEDVAFWGIYGSSLDDRALFSLRNLLSIEEFTLVAVDISDWIKPKAAMLACYKSQSTEVWRPLRYAWTAAREIGAPFGYCERLFVRDDHITRLEELLGRTIVRRGSLQYGTAEVRTAWTANT